MYPAVHPRACGERTRTAQSDNRDNGSSPRLRGTLPCLRHDRHMIRFIPAPAGNANSRRVYQHADKRFIPAPAGNAVVGGRTTQYRSVHPRACGERKATLSANEIVVGSSPRLRGTLCVSEQIHPGDRFIPAPAGNATACKSSVSITAVHPRACGERSRLCIQCDLEFGSSPRLRGTLFPEPPVIQSRFTFQRTYRKLPAFRRRSGQRLRCSHLSLRHHGNQAKAVEVNWYAPTFADGIE